MRSFIQLTTLSSIVLLSACGGASTSNNATSSFSAADQAARVFAETDGDVGNVLQNGGTLSSRGGAVSGINLRFGGGTTNLTDTAVTIKLNPAGELTATLDGQEQVFTLSNRRIETTGESYGYEFEAPNGTTFNLYSQSGELSELLTTGNGFSAVVAVMGDLPDGNGTLYERSYAAIGGETTDARLSTLTGSATYNGYGRLDTYAATDFGNSSTDRNRIRGDVEMTANFAQNAISGNMSNLTLQAPGASDRAALAGQIDFGSASFGQNTFEGAVTANAALQSAGLTLGSDASYNGAFFGPNAEEVSGTISATGSLNGDSVNAIGYFTQ